MSSSLWVEFPKNGTRRNPIRHNNRAALSAQAKGEGCRRSVVLRGESRHLASVLCLSQRRRLYLTILCGLFSQGDMFVSVANHGVRPADHSYTLLKYLEVYFLIFVPKKKFSLACLRCIYREFKKSPTQFAICGKGERLAHYFTLSPPRRHTNICIYVYI